MKAFLYAGISLPLQKPKGDLCAGINEGINQLFSMLTSKNITWIDVIRHFERKGYVHNGLTLPFLIGSRTVLQPGKPLLSIKQFLEEASNPNQMYPITIMKCSDIGEYVFGTMDSETNAIRYRGLYKEFNNIVITDHSFQSCNNLNEITEFLENSYGDYIRAGCYSKLSGQWKPYSSEDLTHLKELL